MNAITTTQNPQMLKPVQQTAAGTFAQYLAARKKVLASVLPKHLTPERVCRVALTAYTRTPALAKCDMASVFQAIQQAAELGLEPGGALNQCYLLPYGNQCQLIVSYKGLIELARRSGEIESIEARAIHENDVYDVAFGLHSDIVHRPCLDGDPGRLVMVYAIARLKGGMVQFEVMTRAEVDAVRARSRSGKSGPWVTDYEQMALKTVIRRLCKYLPISAEKFAEALELDAKDYKLSGAVTEAVQSVVAQVPQEAPEEVIQSSEESGQLEAAPALPEAAEEAAAAAPEEASPVPAEPSPVPPQTSSSKLAARLRGRKSAAATQAPAASDPNGQLFG